MDAGVAVAVGDVEVAERRHGDVGRVVERRAGALDRAEVEARGAGVAAGLPLVPSVEEQLARGRELADRVVEVVGQVDRVVGADGDAVRPREQPLAPGAQELAVPVEDDDRMLAAVEDVHAVARVDGDADGLDEAPAGGQPLPARRRPRSRPPPALTPGSP